MIDTQYRKQAKHMQTYASLINSLDSKCKRLDRLVIHSEYVLVNHDIDLHECATCNIESWQLLDCLNENLNIFQYQNLKFAIETLVLPIDKKRQNINNLLPFSFLLKMIKEQYPYFDLNLSQDKIDNINIVIKYTIKDLVHNFQCTYYDVHEEQ